MIEGDSKYGSPWSREELILAFYLYCQIPFAKTKASNPDVINLARIIGRTPSSVARKLGNFGAFDPLLTKEGITGLTHYSKADQSIWLEFHQDWEKLVVESNRLLTAKGAEGFLPASVETGTDVVDVVLNIPPASTERVSTVVTRLRQSFFRRAVLSSYNHACCICGIDLVQLLVASHIIPWSVKKETRIDPQNGLSLCALHDKAFDKGFITVSSSYKILVSTVVSDSKSRFAQTAIGNFEGQSITLPTRFAPKPEYLEWHTENLFR
jgi:putative restriction endonuclease